MAWMLFTALVSLVLGVFDDVAFVEDDVVEPVFCEEVDVDADDVVCGDDDVVLSDTRADAGKVQNFEHKKLSEQNH